MAGMIYKYTKDMHWQIITMLYIDLWSNQFMNWFHPNYLTRNTPVISSECQLIRPACQMGLVFLHEPVDFLQDIRMIFRNVILFRWIVIEIEQQRRIVFLPFTKHSVRSFGHKMGLECSQPHGVQSCTTVV